MLGSFTGNAGPRPVAARDPARRRPSPRAAMRAAARRPEGAELEARPRCTPAIPEGTRLLGTSRSPTASPPSTCRDEFERRRRARRCRRALAPGRLHADPVLDGRSASVSSSTAARRPRSAARASCSTSRSNAPTSATSCRRSSWTGRRGAPRRQPDARSRGLANVFEATFQVAGAGRQGRILAEKTVTATCGTGCWGSFKADLAYTIGKAQYGTLRVFVYSARTASPRT